MRWILTCLALAGLWVGTAAPELIVGWKDSVKRFLARPAGDWPLCLFGLNAILVSGLVVAELVWAIGSAGSATQSNTMEPPVEKDSKVREKR